MRLLAFVGFAIICCPIMSLTRLTERKSNNHIESRTSSTGNRRQAEKMKKERIPQVDLCQNKGCGACCKGCSTSDGMMEILSYCQPDGSCESTAPDCTGPVDLCQNKGCGEVCAVEDGMAEVLRYCQPDGSCSAISVQPCPIFSGHAAHTTPASARPASVLDNTAGNSTKKDQKQLGDCIPGGCLCYPDTEQCCDPYVCHEDPAEICGGDHCCALISGTSGIKKNDQCPNRTDLKQLAELIKSIFGQWIDAILPALKEGMFDTSADAITVTDTATEATAEE